MCGGTVRIFVHEQGAGALEALEAVAVARDAGEPVALATLLDGASAGTKMAILDDRRRRRSRRHRPARPTPWSATRAGQLDEGLSRVRRYGAGGEVMGSDLAVYIQAFSTQPRMVIFGAIDFSAEMAKLAGEIGYKVTICDARGPFVNSPRFAQVAEVVVDWPDRYLEGRELGPRDVVLVFTHDAKFDEPALISTLAHRRRVRGRARQPPHPGAAGRAAARGGARRRRRSPGSMHPAGSTSGRAHRSRPPCRSSRR